MVAAPLAVDAASTIAMPGEIETVIAGTVMLTEPNARGLATEVAVRVTVRSFAGGVDGAV